MRVFIGIKATDKLQKQILDWQEKNRHLPARFIKPENLHLTLIPPWYENKLNRLVKSLKMFTFREKFEILFNKISIGPTNSPRLIWATGETPPQIVMLRNQLTKYLGKIPLRGKKRPFASHITIARFKKADAASLPKINDPTKLKIQVSQITLFESKLSRLGAEYKIMETIKF